MPPVRASAIRSGATRPAAALAFDHAARLYRTALELHQGGPASAGASGGSWAMPWPTRAEAIEAAQAYARAAETATAAETLELKRLASTQLLLSRTHRGRAGAPAHLAGPAGLSMPKTTRQAWLSLIWHRFQLRLRGLKFLKRDASQISAMDAGQDRPVLVGRGGADDVRADPRG